MNDFSNLSGKIFIPPRNKMSSKVRVIGVGDSSLQSTIVVTRHSNLTSRINVYSDEVIINPSYPPVIGNQRKGKIDILFRDNLKSRISILPRNRMAAKVSVIEPPSYKMELTSVKDAFIRSSIPTLNYGTEESMVIGYNVLTDEKFRSLVEFDTTQIPENAKIQHASLKLYNNQINTGTHQVGVYTASTDWDEYGVTWISQPAIKDIVNVVNLGQTGYSDIDVTESVVNWYSKNESNNGFIVKALNESQSQREQFSTRESSTSKPILEITYKLDIVYSFGRNDMPSNMFVRAVRDSSVRGSIKIPQFDTDGNISSRIHVRNFNYWLEGNISVNRPDMLSNIVIQRHDESSISSNLSVRVKGGHLPQDNMQISLVVNAKDRLGKIRIPYRNQLPASIDVRVYKKDINSLPSKIVVTRDGLRANIKVRQTDGDNLNSNIKVRIHEDLISKVMINRPDLIGKIKITHYDSLSSSITVNQTNNLSSAIWIPNRSNIQGKINIVYASHLPSSISVLSGYLRSRITIPAYGENDKLSRMTIRVKGIGEIHGLINVGGDNILGGYVYIM